MAVKIYTPLLLPVAPFSLWDPHSKPGIPENVPGRGERECFSESCQGPRSALTPKTLPETLSLTHYFPYTPLPHKM